MGGDFDHRLLCLRLSIDCNFVKSQHTVVTKQFLLRFKYDKSKVEEYQMALIASFGNLWVVDLIGHLGADRLVDLLQQCVGVVRKSTFCSKPLGGSSKDIHCHKPWFDIDYRIAKHELRLWLKANPDLHAVKHQESKLKNSLKRNFFLGNYKNSTYVCICQGGCTFVLEKVPTKGTRCGQDQCNYALEGFRGLVSESSPPIRLQTDHSAQVTEPPPNHTLNKYITLVELLQALKKLQRNKVANLDGMKAKFILDAGELLHMPLLTTFNYFLAEGFPEALSIGVVHAFCKGGNAFEFDNYRGITIGPFLTKLFTMILDKRINEWDEQHRLCAKGQSGFHKDYRTTEQLFILQTLIE
jgi:hypothetical protein